MTLVHLFLAVRFFRFCDERARMCERGYQKDLWSRSGQRRSQRGCETLDPPIMTLIQIIKFLHKGGDLPFQRLANSQPVNIINVSDISS